MGYFFFALAIFAGLAKGFFGKKTSDFITNFEYAVLASEIRLFYCLIFGILILLPEVIKNGLNIFIMNNILWLVCICSGILTASIIILWLIIVRENAFCLMEIFSLIGVLLPVILSGILYNEKIMLTQWLSLAVLLIAVILISSYNNQTKTKFTLKSIFLLIVFSVFNGLSDFTQKTFANISKGTVSVSVFNYFTYLVAFVFLLIIHFIIRKKDTKKKKIIINKTMYIYVVIMALMLYLNTFFKTLCANYLTSVQIYPVYQGMILVFSTIMGALFFREKLTLKSCIGILLVLMALFAIYL